MAAPMITEAALTRFAPRIRPDRARVYADVLEGARTLAGLTTRIRLRHFLAQAAHETGGFERLVESTAYSDPARLDRLFDNVVSLDHARRLIADGAQAIACCVYAGRLGNGDAASGDGWRYRGRGFLMTTGKANYRDAQTWSALPLLTQPGLLAQPEPAAQSAARFWAFRGINTEADADDVEGVTRKVNGPALAGLADRTRWLRAAEAVWPDA